MPDRRRTVPFQPGAAARGERAMSPDTLTTTGRLGARSTAAEKETSRLGGLLEGLGSTGRLPPSAAPDRPA